MNFYTRVRRVVREAFVALEKEPDEKEIFRQALARGKKINRGGMYRLRKSLGIRPSGSKESGKGIRRGWSKLKGKK